MAKKDSTNQVSQGHGTVEGNPHSLIGGFHALTDTHPSYHNPISGGEKWTASIDMLRISVRFTDETWALGHADVLIVADETRVLPVDTRIGHYRHMWVYPCGDSTVTFGVGHNGKGGKVDMRSGVIECNPNKCAGDERLFKLFSVLAPHVAKATVKRYDLAFDVPISRNRCRLTKDRRTYNSYISNGITETLGVRNAVGHVRCYDKQAESGLLGVLTRIELTCSGDWSAAEIQDKWPQVHAWTEGESTRDWVRVVGMLLSEKAERGEDIETYIAMLGRGSRPKVRECCRSGMIDLPKEAAEYAVNQAASWAKLLTA